MSYSIMRIEKIKASGVTGIQIHDRREKDGTSHTNKDIDWTRTKENVDLLNQKERFRTVVTNRITELNLKKKIRSDATVMCQCLVTSDNVFFSNMSRQEQTEYFRLSLEFLEKRYGKKNLVSATIHFDEQTPHMHVNFVPVTSDERLSARDLFSPRALRKLQDDYNRFVRENGYDLERGEIDSKVKHLNVEEYKVNTKFEQVKEKKAELDRLKQVDKQVDLNVEKGKFAYSVKEVEAMKDQNKALKIDNIQKDNKIKELENEVSKLQKQLETVQNKLQGLNVPINRLSNLESENRALQEYVKMHPELEKLLEHFNQMKEQSYHFGQVMCELKNKYLDMKDKREKSIQNTYTLGKQAEKCDFTAEGIRKLKKDIENARNKCQEYEKELELTKGLFKSRQKQVLQEHIEEEQRQLKKLQTYLKKEYEIEYIDIPQKLMQLQQEKKEALEGKKVQIQFTDGFDLDIEQTIKEYKYLKVLAEIQQKDLQEISFRMSNVEKFTLQGGRAFYISRDDRKEILERMKKECPELLKRCILKWEVQDSIESQEQKQNLTLEL
ncbi:MobV family relaxase [Anaeromicropila populeti]|uniref:Plasmid recombination enzyme n=1 Tax=Anaeromicropila populeti TaxID=37658 RepID=A0A1I6LWG9_9FIRM|nr:MobV family relaxase [Anaeromicropila populeti]SFS07821.1 Plasmid recombination enzyme [Anaeromicropila populeti]